MELNIKTCFSASPASLCDQVLVLYKKNVQTRKGKLKNVEDLDTTPALDDTWNHSITLGQLSSCSVQGQIGWETLWRGCSLGGVQPSALKEICHPFCATMTQAGCTLHTLLQWGQNPMRTEFRGLLGPSQPSLPLPPELPAQSVHCSADTVQWVRPKLLGLAQSDVLFWLLGWFYADLIDVVGFSWWIQLCNLFSF